MTQPSISVIVPVYGVEKYIERCARSLFKQTISDQCEYIFVDDCTKDRSVEVLKKVVDEYPTLRIVILYHLHNKGLAGARNTGLNYATGKYIAHVDSDDYIDDDMLESLYNRAESDGSDMVWCDYYMTCSNREVVLSQTCATDRIECIRAIMTGALHGSVCNKFVLRSLYVNNKIRFPEGNDVWEDVASSTRLFACAEKIAYIPRAFYHYVQYNSGAYTKDISIKRCMQQVENVKSIICFMTEKGLKHYFEDVVGQFKLRSKLLLLYSYKKDNYNLWRATFPEANEDIDSTNLGLRLLLLQKAAKNRYDWFLRINELMRRCKRLVK